MPVSSLIPITDCAEVSDNSLFGKSLKDILSDVGCDMVDAHRCVESDSIFEEEVAKSNNINMLSSCRTVLIIFGKSTKKSRNPHNTVLFFNRLECQSHRLAVLGPLVKKHAPE